MKRKRGIALGLALVLCLSLLAGCGKGGETDKTGTAGTGAAEASVSGSVDNPQGEGKYEGQLPLSKEKVTLRFATNQGANSSMAPPSNDLPVYQYLEEITNVHIEWDTIPGDSYATMMNTRIASGSELPDVLNLSGLGNYEKLAKDNIIIPQTDLIEEYGYHVKKFFETNPAYKALMTNPDGNIYCIENTVLDSNLTTGFMVDKYSMEKAGVEKMPETIDEFYNMLVKFKNTDLSGNGKMDTIPLVIPYRVVSDFEYLNVLGNAFGLEMTWDWGKYYGVGDDGKLVSNYKLPQYKEFLKFLNKLYVEDLICKDFTTMPYDKMIEYVTKGQAPVVGYWTTYAYLFGDASPDAAPFKAEKKGEQVPIYVPMAPLKAPNGEQYFTKRSGLNGDGMGITVDCKEELRPVAMKWIDFLFGSPEAHMTQSYGVEGLSYNKKSDGTIEKISPEGKEWGSYVTEIGGNQPPRAHQQLIDAWRNSWLPKWLDDRDQELSKYYKDGKLLPIKFTADEETAVNKLKPDIDVFLEENIIAFMTGKKSMDDYDKFTEELDKRGFDEMKTYYQSRYDRQTAQKK